MSLYTKQMEIGFITKQKGNDFNQNFTVFKALFLSFFLFSVFFFFFFFFKVAQV